MKIRHIRRIVIIIFTVIISLLPSYAQDVSIPSFHSTNKSINNIKYKMRIEPVYFETMARTEIVFDVYLNYKVTYSDDTTEEDEIYIDGPKKYPSVPVSTLIHTNGCGMSLDSFGYFNLLNEMNVYPIIYEDSKLVESKAEGLEVSYDIWDESFFSILPFIETENFEIACFPYNPVGCFDGNNFSFVNGTEDAAQPNTRATQEFDYYILGYLKNVDKLLEFNYSAKFNNLGYIVKDGTGHTFVSADNIEEPIYNAKISKLGQTAEYLESIKIECMLEFKWEGWIWHFEASSIYHIEYPKSEECKEAARKAGYNVP